MKVKLATAVIAVASLGLSSCGGWISTDIGGGYYPSDPIYTGPVLPPVPDYNSLPPVVVNPGPVNGGGGPARSPGNGGGTGNRPNGSTQTNPPGNNDPSLGSGKGGGNPGSSRPSSGSNSGKGSRPISTPAQPSGGSGSGATRTH